MAIDEAPCQDQKMHSQSLVPWDGHQSICTLGFVHLFKIPHGMDGHTPKPARLTTMAQSRMSMVTMECM